MQEARSAVTGTYHIDMCTRKGQAARFPSLTRRPLRSGSEHRATTQMIAAVVLK